MVKVVIDYLGNKKPKIKLSVGKNQSLIYFLVGLKPGFKEVIVKLTGEEAEVKILGFFIGRKGKSQIKTTQHHLVSKTKSSLLIKSVVFEQASFNYHGLIRIEKKAERVEASQKNDNLIMGDKAQVDTKPELEILADKVSCSHGATVARIDEDHLFYLMSRGIPRLEAEKLIVEGFFKKVIGQIPDQTSQAKINNSLNKILNYA